jgi:hypothetical protein
VVSTASLLRFYLSNIQGAQGFILTDKILKTLIVVGVLICFSALLTLPAALSDNKDQELLGTALAVFGIGTLFVALSLYLQSRSLRSRINADPNLVAALQGTKRKGTCDNCKSATPVIQCTMHRVTLCASCLVQHYDSRGCVYVPAVRKTTRSRAGAAGRA